MSLYFIQHVCVFLYLLIAISLLFTCSSFSQQWHLAGGTENYYMAGLDIYRSNPDTLYATGRNLAKVNSLVYDVLRSTDKGEHWDSISSLGTGGGVIRVDPYDSRLIYASAAGRNTSHVYLSTDGGNTWTHLFGGGAGLTSGEDVQIDPANHNTIYAGFAGGILARSFNKGAMWDTLFPEVHFIGWLGICRDQDSILYFSDGYAAGVHKSTDRGETWMVCPFPFSALSVWGLVVHPHNPDVVYVGVFSFGYTPGGVYKSTDGGNSWNSMNNGLDSTNWMARTLTMNPKNPEQLFFGQSSVNHNLIFETDDGGKTWHSIGTTLPDSATVNAVAIDTLNNRLYAGMTGGLYYTDLVTSVSQSSGNHFPRAFSLSQNYPNPFNPSTTIEYELPSRDFVSLKVYNMLGQEVAALVNDVQEAGRKTVKFDSKGLPSGMYFYRIATQKGNEQKPMIVIK
jgi:photosystem II stability/assembly factor-like uncharacterized protein